MITRKRCHHFDRGQQKNNPRAAPSIPKQKMNDPRAGSPMLNQKHRGSRAASGVSRLKTSDLWGASGHLKQKKYDLRAIYFLFGGLQTPLQARKFLSWFDHPGLQAAPSF
jgi:hypothetical protein